MSMLSDMKQTLRSWLVHRYSTNSAHMFRDQFGEQLAYGHREVLIKYMGLPKSAYFKASLTHSMTLPHSIENLRVILDQKHAPLLQLLWRSDAEQEAKLNNISGIRTIGATGIYALLNLGFSLKDISTQIKKVSSQHYWSSDSLELIDFLHDKKVLYLPTHSWDGDVVNYKPSNLEMLRKLNPDNVRVLLGYLDFCDPKKRTLLQDFGWKLECAGVRASKVFGSPAGGRVNFLYELFKIIEWSDIVIADSYTTGLFYSACLGKNIGVLPLDLIELEYSYWRKDASDDYMVYENKVKNLFPWLYGKEVDKETIFNDIATSLGLDKIKSPEQLKEIIPWYLEPALDLFEF